MSRLIDVTFLKKEYNKIEIYEKEDNYGHKKQHVAFKILCRGKYL